MNKDTALGILRTILTLVGTYIVGHNLLGKPVDASIWQEILGAILTLFSIIWGIIDKSASIEQIQSAMRSVLVSIGGLLVAAGKISGQSLEAIVGLFAALIPALQSHTSKVKVQQINTGKLEVTDSGKVQPAAPKVS